MERLIKSLIGYINILFFFSSGEKVITDIRKLGSRKDRHQQRVC